MSTALAVQWHIAASQAPQPLLPCNRCDRVTAYRHSGKFRLNAQGRRLDAWLIYRCTECDNSWNRPIFERRNVRDIDRGTLQALQDNDAETVDRFAHDIDHLKRAAPRVIHGGGVRVSKAPVSADTPPWMRLDIAIVLPVPAPMRMDRLLARELGVSRSRLQGLYREGRLRLPEARRRALRLPVIDGMRVTLDLAGLNDADAIGMAATGPSGSIQTFGPHLPRLRDQMSGSKDPLKS